MIYQCTGCDIFTLQSLGSIKHNPTENNPSQVKFGVSTGPPVAPTCEHCGNKHHLGGPIWSNPIHDKSFVKELLSEILKEPLSNLGTHRRLIGMLSVIEEELSDSPLYYLLDNMCSIVKLEVMPILKFRSALLNAGYKVSFSHASKNSVKTDAPASVLWDIIRCWNKTHPVKSSRMIDGTPVKTILSKEPSDIYNFDDIHPEANPKSRKKALSRFQTNPTAHWGPGTRATIMIGKDKVAKSFRNQNKKQKSREAKVQTNNSDDEQSSKKMKQDVTRAAIISEHIL